MRCFISIFKSIDKHELAVEYKKRRRKIEPAVYNHRRLNEKPFPILKTKPSSTKKRTTPKSVERPTTVNHATVDQPTVFTLDTPPNSPVPVCDENERNMTSDNRSVVS